jgi:hypothetical protein
VVGSISRFFSFQEEGVLTKPLKMYSVLSVFSNFTECKRPRSPAPKGREDASYSDETLACSDVGVV